MVQVACDLNVDSPVTNCVNKLHPMHQEEHRSLIHVEYEVQMTMGLTETSWVCNLHVKSAAAEATV